MERPKCGFFHGQKIKMDKFMYILTIFSLKVSFLRYQKKKLSIWGLINVYFSLFISSNNVVPVGLSPYRSQIDGGAAIILYINNTIGDLFK